jgi:anaerobic selenocysteine-containing dehydrogenase
MAEVLIHRVRPLFSAHSGGALCERPQTSVNFTEFWSSALEGGGWVGTRPGQSPRRFPTQTGKIELVAHEMQTAAGVNQTPCIERPVFHGSPGEYPLHLIVYVPPWFYSGGDEPPWQRQVAGEHGDDTWQTVAEIHPALARQREVEDGDPVLVKTLAGSAVMRARITDRALPDVVSIPLNRGHLAQGLWHREASINTPTLLRAVLDPTTSHPLWDRTRADIVRVASSPTRWTVNNINTRGDRTPVSAPASIPPGDWQHYKLD